MSNIRYSWAFTPQFQRGKKWYMIAITLALTVIIVSFLFGAYPLGIIAILFVGVYLLYEFSVPSMTQILIDDIGIAIDQDIYSYPKIYEFGIIRIKEGPTILRIGVKSYLLNSIDIFVDPTIDIEELRLYLSAYIPENTQLRFSLVDRILLGLKI